MSFDEQGLLRRASSFERDALVEIYDHFSPGLYRYAMRLLGDVNLAEDCVSETFTRILNALATRRGPKDHLQAYIYRVAHNWITDYFRRPILPVQEIDEDSLPSRDPLPESALTGYDEQQGLRRALIMLTPDQRQVIVLRFIEGWELEEVAASLGKPHGAVKSLQHRGLVALKKMLIDQEEA
jgi:RNA polymerase sigma-70 factor (ECF subfamily)